VGGRRAVKTIVAAQGFAHRPAQKAIRLVIGDCPRPRTTTAWAAFSAIMTVMMPEVVVRMSGCSVSARKACGQLIRRGSAKYLARTTKRLRRQLQRAACRVCARHACCRSLRLQSRPGTLAATTPPDGHLEVALPSRAEGTEIAWLAWATRRNKCRLQPDGGGNGWRDPLARGRRRQACLG